MGNAKNSIPKESPFQGSYRHMNIEQGIFKGRGANGQ
jgi:hypothetical protein